MDPKLPVQLLLTRRRFICRKCMHGNQVEEIRGRANSAVEYHCGCGNYAVVGMPAKFPFMEVVKEDSNFSQNYSQNYSSDCEHSETGSSPMQLGESLVKAMASGSRKLTKPAQLGKTIANKTVQNCKCQEVPIMSGKRRNPTCKRPGCEMEGPFHGYCAKDFTAEFGISYKQYSKFKLYRGEGPREVAIRIKVEAETQTDERKPPLPEQKEPKPEKKPVVREPKQAKPETPKEVEKPEPLPLTPEQEAKQEAYEPGEGPGGLAATAPIGLVGKDYITIVAREEFINKIREAADREFRTPDQQVAFYLHKGMEACGV